MKRVTLTNATIIPFYRADKSKEPEILRIHDSKNPDSDLKIVTFNIETKVKDDPERKARLFERCVIYASTEDKLKKARNTIRNGSVVEIEGYEERRKGTDEKFYNSIVVTDMVPISGEKREEVTEVNPDDDLPF